MEIDFLLEIYWGVGKVNIVQQLKLDYLEINVKSAYCPNGCCRLAEAAADTMSFRKFGLPKRVVIKGTKNDLEMEAVLDVCGGTVINESPGRRRTNRVMRWTYYFKQESLSACQGFLGFFEDQAALKD